jgi:hypothetical protein
MKWRQPEEWEVYENLEVAVWPSKERAELAPDKRAAWPMERQCWQAGAAQSRSQAAVPAY